MANEMILTTLHFHDVFAKFFTSSLKHCSNTFPYLSLVAESWQLHFRPSHWSPGHMAHYNLPLANYQITHDFPLHVIVHILCALY